jgi:hypothetical protein
MSVSVTMPPLGEGVSEGIVTRWLKQPGDQVEVGEPLLEVSTDKVDTEIPSPVSGVLTAIRAHQARPCGWSASWRCCRTAGMAPGWRLTSSRASRRSRRRRPRSPPYPQWLQHRPGSKRGGRQGRLGIAGRWRSSSSVTRCWESTAPSGSGSPKVCWRWGSWSASWLSSFGVTAAEPELAGLACRCRCRAARDWAARRWRQSRSTSPSSSASSYAVQGPAPNPQVTGYGGGGGTRTPVPWRRPRASPSAATGCVSDLGCPVAPHPGPSPLECSRTGTGAPNGWSLLSTPDPLPQARSGGRPPK